MEETLYNRANIMFEMGNHFVSQAHTQDETLVVGYSLGQALELYLKYISGLVCGEYSKTHHLHVHITNIYQTVMRYRSEGFNFESEIMRFNSITYDILARTRLYNNLAFSGKYDKMDLFTVQDLQLLQDDVIAIKTWLSRNLDELRRDSRNLRYFGGDKFV